MTTDTDATTVTNEMLAAAMRAAVNSGLVPRTVDHDTYVKTWAAMREVLAAALGARQ